MYVQLKLRLDAPVDAVSDALTDPAVMVAVAGPLLQYRSEAPEGFPSRWSTQPHPVSASLFGLAPLGRTRVDLDWHEREGAWIQTDTGRGITGTFLRMRIKHRMAVSPLGAGRTLLRDRLEFHAGLLGVALWPGLWLTWQWRAYRLRTLAPTWQAPEPRGAHAG